jgi:hypothetical protein
VRAAQQVRLSRSADGETVTLQGPDGILYGLNRVGCRIWSLLEQPREVSQLRALLLAEYEVESEPCERDLLTLLKQLDGAGLIVVEHPEQHGCQES